MQGLTNTIQNSSLASLTQGAPRSVISAIADASAGSGVDFAYLVQQAKAESSFNPDAKAKTSSATGLYQFISSTWMDMVDRYGETHGIETEGKSKSEILDLRKDPDIAANMAAEFASENERFLESHWAKGEQEIGSTELYFAHFMGAGGAAAFLNARDSDGSQPAAVIFPSAAKANQNVFYERGSGRAKSLDEVYAFFDKKFDIKDIDPSAVKSAEPSETLIADAAEAISNENANAIFSSASMMPTNMHPSFGGLYDLQVNSPIFTSTRAASASLLPQYAMVQSPLEIMLMSQLDSGLLGERDERSSIF